ncbi:MAG: serine hydrolase domain-containing protein [Anaerolineae bacterium]
MHDLQAVLSPILESHLGNTFPACTIQVNQAGTVLFNRAYGWIDPETQQFPTRPETLFDLASITKLFTTTAFLSLVSEGRITLEDRLVSILPEFGAITPRPIDGGQDPHTKERLPTPPERASQTADPAAVTFWHLLTHTSGLPPWRDGFNAVGDAPVPPTQIDPMPRAERWARALRALCSYAFVSPPDNVVRYSDVGLMLLGEAVTRLHGGNDLSEVLQARVISPLGRTDVMFNPVSEGGRTLTDTAPTEDDPTWRRRRVWGEVHDENACGVGGVAGHAGLFATAEAVAALGQAWLEGASRFGINSHLATEATREQAQSDGTRRGLGFALKAATDSMAGDRMSMRAYGHSGFTGTTVWIDPAHELVVVLLTNRVYPGRWHGGIHEFRRAAHDAICAALGIGG